MGDDGQGVGCPGHARLAQPDPDHAVHGHSGRSRPTTSRPPGRWARAATADPAPAHPAERPGAGDRLRDDRARDLHRAEATLSFLGVGLQPPVVSWGIAINDACRLRAAVAAHAALPVGVPVASPCWRSSCWATRSATPSTRNCAEEPHVATTETSLRRMRPPPATSRCSRSTTSRSSSAPGTASPRRSTASPTRLEAGETLAVLGESGSGKTVTAQAIMGILDTPPGFVTGGEIRFRGQDLLTPCRRTSGARSGRRDRDDLPGRAVVAEPGLHRRLPDRRDVPRAPRACPRRTPSSAPSS